MKNIIFYLNCIFIAPILIVHEFLHLLFGELVRDGYTGFKLKRDGLFPEVELFHRDAVLVPRWKRMIMSFAPLLLPLSVLVLSIFFPFFLYILGYFVLVIAWTWILGAENPFGWFLSGTDLEYATDKMTMEEYDRLVEESMSN